MSPSEQIDDEGPFDAAGDAAMDALLCDFFRREVPPLLPAEADDAPIYSMRSRSGWSPSWSVVAIAAGVLAALGIAHWVLPEKKSAADGSGDAKGQPIYYASTDVPDVVPTMESPAAMEVRSEFRRDAADREVEYRIANGRRLLDTKAVETPQGAFAQETELRWTTISFIEPSTGERVEATVPEVEIRIVPVKFQ